MDPVPKGCGPSLHGERSPPLPLGLRVRRKDTLCVVGPSTVPTGDQTKADSSTSLPTSLFPSVPPSTPHPVRTRDTPDTRTIAETRSLCSLRSDTSVRPATDRVRRHMVDTLEPIRGAERLGRHGHGTPTTTGEVSRVVPGSLRHSLAEERKDRSTRGRGGTPSSVVQEHTLRDTPGLDESGLRPDGRVLPREAPGGEGAVTAE